MADVGEILGGRLVREVLGGSQIVFLIFIMGRHIIFFSIALNKVTSHATCTIAWAVLAFVISFVVTIPRTLKSVSHISITGKYASASTTISRLTQTSPPLHLRYVLDRNNW